MPALSINVKKALLPSPKGRTVYVTLGNSLRGDDGVGNYIAENLQVHREGIFIVPAEDKPERIVDQIMEVRPAKTVIIDAVDFDGQPGEVRQFNLSSCLFGTALSTHRFPPEIIASILIEDLGTEVLFLGIQIRRTKYGSPIEEKVQRSADTIIAFLNVHFRISRKSSEKLAVKKTPSNDK